MSKRCVARFAACCIAWIWLKPRNTCSPRKAARRFRPVADERQHRGALLGRERVEVDQRPDAPEMVEPVEHLLGEERRDGFDPRAGGLEIARRPLDRRADLRGRRISTAGLRHEPDLEARKRRRADRPIERRVLEARVVARVRLRQRRHHQARVGDAAGHRAGDAPDIGRVDRHAPGGRLQADEAAPAGRQADRAADVGAHMKRSVERSRRRPRPGRRAAGVAVEPPWVSRQRMMARKSGRQHAVIGHGRLGEQDRPGLLEARGGRRVGFGRRHVARRGADRGRVALGRDVVLDGHRHAVERADRLSPHPARFRGARLFQRALGRIEPGRRDMRLERLDAPDDRGHGLDGRQGFRTVGGEEVERRQTERLHDQEFPLTSTTSPTGR